MVRGKFLCDSDRAERNPQGVKRSDELLFLSSSGFGISGLPLERGVYALKVIKPSLEHQLTFIRATGKLQTEAHCREIVSNFAPQLYVFSVGQLNREFHRFVARFFNLGLHETSARAAVNEGSLMDA